MSTAVGSLIAIILNGCGSLVRHPLARSVLLRV